MGEKKITYEEYEPGQITSRHIINIENGVILCKKGRELTKELLIWLQNFNHTPVYIETKDWESVWKLEEKQLLVYDESKKKLKSTLENFRYKEKINMEAIGEVKHSFFQNLNNNSTIMGCVNQIKEADEYTYIHSLNVGMLCVLMGKWLGLEPKQQEELMLAGLLHDIGKYRVPESILNKKGSLTPEEMLVMKKHVNYGFDILGQSPNLSDEIKKGVLSHHERIDGSGYPRGLVGDEIPLYAKIIGVADVYDAMISERVYKKRETPFIVMEHMIHYEMGRLDPEVLLTFLKHVADYYIGVEVLLNTGEKGTVVFIPSHCVYRPILKVNENYIDLCQEKKIHIVDII